MKSRPIVLVIVIVCTICHSAVGQPKRKTTQNNAASLDSTVVSGGTQRDPLLAELSNVKPEMPLGPEDVLKSYEVAMSLVAEKTSNDISVIVQAHQSNQITRQQAEYLVQQLYQVAMMQYQVLSALHEVLRHDIDEALQSTRSRTSANSEEAVIAPSLMSPTGSK